MSAITELQERIDELEDRVDELERKLDVDELQEARENWSADRGGPF